MNATISEPSKLSSADLTGGDMGFDYFGLDMTFV